MKYEFEHSDGYPLMRLYKNCGFEQFYEVADIIESKLDSTFSNKLNDFDSLFWDFEYNLSKLTLHYNTFLGLSIFPTKLQNYDQADSKAILEIGDLLFN